MMQFVTFALEHPKGGYLLHRAFRSYFSSGGIWAVHATNMEYHVVNAVLISMGEEKTKAQLASEEWIFSPLIFVGRSKRILLPTGCRIAKGQGIWLNGVGTHIELWSESRWEQVLDDSFNMPGFWPTDLFNHEEGSE